MAPAAVKPTTMDRVVSVGRWFRSEFAEWVVGTWAQIIGWFIFLTIFFNFLEMDGFFSRGLGEGSGVNPDLFQHIGWMFRLFAAVFLTLATKFAAKDMKGQANKLKIIGAFATAIVILHAMGFGLKALHGKYANANSVAVVAETVTQSNDTVIATLTAQKQSILEVLAVQTAPLNDEITRLDTDGKRNEELANRQKQRRDELQNAAQTKIDAIDAQILAVTASAGEHQATTAKEVATAEPWPPLYVGLAQLFTWSEKPTDGAIYLCGVIFLMFWILLGDAICIFLPPALYALHLKDAKQRHVKLSPDVFKDLQEQADELARRKANLDEGVTKRTRGKKRKEDIAANRLAIADLREELARREEVQSQDETAPEPPADEPTEATNEDGEPEATLELTEADAAPESPEAPEAANEPEVDNPQDKAA